MFYSNRLIKISEIRHCFFSRKKGFSKGIYKGLNCVRVSKDTKKNVRKNLNYVAKKMQIKKDNLVLMYQTHSNKVVKINRKNFKRRIHSDAIISQEKGLALGVVTADCVPILIYDKKNKIIGCIHAGWRGAFSDIIKKTVLEIKKISRNNKIYASVGPCIDKKNYEVDQKFFNKFLKKSKNNKKYFSKKNKYKKLFNLRNFVADKLKEQNVKVDHINLDTFKEKNYFFSYRRSTFLKEKDYGRCISVISLI